ncbi:amidase [Brachionus plicatilis]|uniref:Amidase n=1 Tax=Brachionus plicatilis TaxID=10195 RepID=A0A3M7QC44_BRAPC|nr:amidase [Brachionus plicatilis]
MLMLVLASVLFCQKEVVSFKNFDFKIETIHSLISSGEYNCTNIVQFFQSRVVKYNPMINAIISNNPIALQQAADLDNYFHRNKKFKGLLHCVPLAVKDNIDVTGIPTTGGIKSLRYSIPNKNALVIDRLLAQGAIILFKTNLGELAFGSRISEIVGECMNPFDSERSCGPSSFGSGAAVSSGLSVISLGTDTSGSVLYPGSFNGIFSLRPALNTTPLDGIIPLFEKADTVGPFAKHLDDLVTTFSIMAQNDSIRNEFSNKIPLDQLKIGVISNFVDNLVHFVFGSKYEMDQEVKLAFERTINRFKILGLSVQEFSLNKTEFENLFYLLDNMFDSYVQCLISSKKKSMDYYFGDVQRFESDSPFRTFEQLFKSKFLNDYWREDFNISLILANDQSECNIFDLKVEEMKNLIFKWYEQHDLDCIIIPTSTNLPDIREQKEDSDFLTSAVFFGILTGLPTLNLPVGFSEKSENAPDGLPIGLSLMSKPDQLNKLNKMEITPMTELRSLEALNQNPKELKKDIFAAMSIKKIYILKGRKAAIY